MDPEASMSRMWCAGTAGVCGGNGRWMLVSEYAPTARPKALYEMRCMVSP
jgi:hypothetical protein